VALPSPPPAQRGTTVGEVGEAALLERLHPWLTHGAPGLVVGPGDDAAVWQPPLGHAIVTTTDSLVEGRHFLTPLAGNAAVDLGWRLLAVSLSDLAAMGAAAGPAVISLALPPEWPVAWVEALYQGLAECGAQFDAPISGGNISAAATAVLTSTCVGSLDPSQLLRRAGAEPGWVLAVTGAVGAAAASLQSVRAGADIEESWRGAARPVPRLEAAPLLVRAGIRVAVDVSDGLFVDAGRLLHGAPGCGLLFDGEAIPVAAGIRERWPREWMGVAGGGEDYELLFAGPEAQVARGCAALRAIGLTPAVIARFDNGPGVRVRDGGEERPAPASGHEHFRD
jgi:thiamine-monophosphate kinase